MPRSADDKTMLIVEDDTPLRERMAAAMRKRGFDVQTAASIAEGASTIAAQVPKYAIIDLRLEDGSGLDLVRDLETRDPEARAIILTGYGDIPTAVAAARIGAVDYMAKPATAEDIVDVLMAPKDETPPAPRDPVTPEAARLEHIEHVFHEAGNNVSHAARLLNMHRRTLQRILKRAGVTSSGTQQ